MTKRLSVALVGNPNCGKTTLFNQLTGSQQKVGNWAGVTVAKKTGQLVYKKTTLDITDLPGIYSLSVATPAGCIDERIACQYLLDSQPDVIVNIVDAAHLKRHLFLSLQLLEIGIPCILAVNMLDVAEKQQLHIDCAALAKALGCPVIPLISNRGVGIEELKAAIVKVAHDPAPPLDVRLPPAIETEVAALLPRIAQHALPIQPHYHRWLAIRLLEKDVLAMEIVPEELTAEAAQSVQRIESEYGEDGDLILADCRYQKIAEIVTASVNVERQIPHHLTQRIDALVLNQWLGIPIFLLVMYLMFEISMSVGALLQPLFEETSYSVFVDGVQYLGQITGAPAWLTAILAQGIGLGIHTVLSFTPQIGLLFLVLSFLEDSGYMARAAFVVDRFMQVIGLPGKAFIPLIVGFGCNVPAIMATRTLESHRDRVLTTMMAPFMSCGARLAIFVVFGAVFFPSHAGVLTFLLYIFGIIAAMLTGLLLKSTLLRGQAAPFVLEMPTYHIPTWQNLWLLTWQRLKGFVWRAGSLIVPACVLIGGLNAITVNSESVLETVSKKVTPVFAPMGIKDENWPATVGLLTGILAKEVVVGTLNTLYVQEAPQDDLSSFHLGEELKAAVVNTITGFGEIFTPQVLNPLTATIADHEMSSSALNRMALAFGSAAAAFSYLLFVLLYVPCVSTVGAISREIGWRWAVLSLVWSTSVAYSAAVFVYQCSIWAAHPQSATLWLLGLCGWQLLWWLMLRLKTRSLTICYP